MLIVVCFSRIKDTIAHTYSEKETTRLQDCAYLLRKHNTPQQSRLTAAQRHSLIIWDMTRRIRPEDVSFGSIAPSKTSAWLE